MKLRAIRNAVALPVVGTLMYFCGVDLLRASDHLDTRTVVADPTADIGDLYAWMAPDGRRLNLVMTVVGHEFSHQLRYTFHIDSGARFGETGTSTTIECRFPRHRAHRLPCGRRRSCAGRRQ
jgi:hypothetical protein